MGNERLTLKERKTIEKLLKQGKSCGEISKAIGRGKNTVVVEVRRLGGKENYNAIKAQKDSDKRWKERFDKVSNTLKGNSYQSTLTKRVNNLEFQIEILLDTIKGLQDENNKLRDV